MSHPSFCLVADASCDLPESLREHPKLRILPVRVVVGKDCLVDRRHSQDMVNFYAHHLGSEHAVHAHSEPLSIEEMQAIFTKEIALRFDEALGVFVSASRSAIFARAKHAVARARRSSYYERLRQGRNSALQIDCVDSKSLFAGYAAQIVDLLEHVDAGAGFREVAARQDAMLAHTYAYMAPGDVSYILERASIKGEKSVGSLAGFAAKSLSIVPIIRAHLGETQPVGRRFGRVNAQKALFELACSMIVKQHLLSPNVCVSYSGNLQDIQSQLCYTELVNTAKAHGVRVHLAPMSVTGSVNVGPGAVVVGFLARKHDAADFL